MATYEVQIHSLDSAQEAGERHSISTPLLLTVVLRASSE